jgi:hypothetical protein
MSGLWIKDSSPHRPARNRVVRFYLRDQPFPFRKRTVSDAVDRQRGPLIIEDHLFFGAKKNCLEQRGDHSGGAQTSATSVGSSSSSSNKVYDKKDANKDWDVSVQEVIAYDLKNPEETENNQSESATGKQQISAGYDQVGNLKTGTSGKEGLFSQNA